MRHYTLKACDNLIKKYAELNGEIIQLREGVLGHGKILLKAAGKKTTIIEEVFVNEWNCTHKIRMYNKTPKKYLDC